MWCLSHSITNLGRIMICLSHIIMYSSIHLEKYLSTVVHTPSKHFYTFFFALLLTSPDTFFPSSPICVRRGIPPGLDFPGVVLVFPFARWIMTALFAGSAARDRASWARDFDDVFFRARPLDDASGRGDSFGSRAGDVGGEPLGVFFRYQVSLK